MIPIFTLKVLFLSGFVASLIATSIRLHLIYIHDSSFSFYVYWLERRLFRVFPPTRLIPLASISSHTPHLPPQSSPSLPILLRQQQIRQPLHHEPRPLPLIPFLKLLPATDPSQHPQRPRQPPLVPEPNVRVRSISNHARARRIELKFPLDRRHHRLAGLAEGNRAGLAVGLCAVATEHGDERSRNSAGAGEEGVGVGQGRVGVGGQEQRAVVLDVVEGEGELEVVDVEIEAREDDADVWVDEGGVGGGDEGVVLGCDVAAVGGVGAADVGDALGGEFGINAGFAEDEDLWFEGGGAGGGAVGGAVGRGCVEVRVGLGEDARDVNSGAVGGAEDLLDAGGNAHRGEFLAIVLTGFGAVVRHKDDLFLFVGIGVVGGVIVR